ncbi:MAG: PAS domain S-box protein, partial [Spirochaetales bacterium]|nr:PAS domain S-box protein [Spirochaetales bacterium]
MQRRIRVLVALSDADDIPLVESALGESGCSFSYASNLMAVEEIMGDSDVILADTGFASGAFSDWLSLWPVPTVLIVDPNCDPQRLAKNLVDESSSFIIRDPEGAWLRFVPLLVRKSAAIRESLDRQNTTVIRTENSYMNLLRVVPDIVYVLDGDGCFAYLNDAVAQLGWKPAELVGKHFAEIVHPEDLPEIGRSIVLRRFEGMETGPSAAPKLFDERRTGDRMTRNLEVRLRHRDGGDWTTANVDAWGEVTSLGVNLPEFEGRGTGTIGLIHDISKRHEMEQSMARELDARDLLLKEIHHRVKNNLQVVSSLLSLESDCVSDEKARNVFEECQTQVYSMSLVHEQIYRGSSPKGVETTAYFAKLAEYLLSVHDAQARGIGIVVDAGSLVLPLDSAMPLSIVTTELVSNSFKHGYPDSKHGTIRISLKFHEDEYEFAVSDDGVGFQA